MPEILGNAVKYTDVRDENIFAKDLNKIVGDIELRKQLSSKGIKKVKEYSWKKTVKETYKVYNNVL